MAEYINAHLINGDGDIRKHSIDAIMPQEIQKESMERMPSQKIFLEGDDSCNSFSVYGREVDIVMSQASISGDSSASSNKVKISPIVKYEWEHKYYHGNLVAIHRHGVFIAYSLKGRTSGIVRVVNRKTAERALLKGFIGDVEDLSFAHISAIVLGVVDENGNMFIYEILDGQNGKIEHILLLQVNRAAGSMNAKIRRLIWCPYLPENEDSSCNTIDEGSVDDAGKLLVLTHDDVAEMWSIDLVSKTYGSGPLLSSEVKEGLITVRSHDKAILDATFSPDGSALATASMDGNVKFFQSCMEEIEAPRCLHQWQPHGGKPVNFLTFLDNHKHPSTEVQFWKYAVTGGDMNTEIRVWSCESWTCLQSISFSVMPGISKYEPRLKAVLDPTANYVVLTDIPQKALYVLQMHQNDEANTALVCSVSEFLLTQPCLSFAILEAGHRKLRKSQDHEDEHLGDMTTGEIQEDDEDNITGHSVNGADVGVLLRLCCVHTKALQELQICFKPESLIPQPLAPSVSSVSQDEVGIRDGLSDLSLDVIATDGDEGQSDISNHSETSHQAGLSYPPGQSQPKPKPLLLTPQAFSASIARIHEAPQNLDVVHSSVSSSFTHVTATNEELASQNDELGTESTARQHESPRSSVTLTPASSHDKSSPGTTSLSCRIGPVSAETLLASPNELQEDGTVNVVTSSPVHSSRICEVVAGPTSECDIANSVDFTMTSSTGSSFNRRTQLQSTGSSSSTSLEVSEILGEVSRQPQLQEYINSQEVEELLEPDKTDAETENNLTKPVSDEKAVTTCTMDNETVPHASFEKGEWPKAPDVSEVDSEARRLAQEALDKACTMHMQGDSLMQQSAEEEPGKSEDELEKPEVSQTQESPVTEPRADARITTSPVSRNTLDKLAESIQSLMEQVKKQQSVQTEVFLGQIKQGEGISRLNDRIDMLEGTLAARVAGALNQHSQTESHLLKAALSENDLLHKEKQDQFLHSLNASISQKIDKAMKYEIKHTVVPSVTGVLQPLKEQLHVEMAQKLTATDALMKENIAKMVRSKHTIEAIGQAATTAVQGPMQASYRDAFQSIFVPAFDRACQTLFHQVNETFQKGTKEFVQQLESYIERSQQRQQELKEPIVQQLNSIVEEFKRASEQTQADIVTTVRHEMDIRLHACITSLKDTLPAQIKNIVKQELDASMKEQQSVIEESVLTAMRAGAATPRATPLPITPVMDTREMHQTHLLQLLKLGQLNAAFQEALSASNLELVMFVCENLNPAKVFNQTPSPLQQPVLLSLIQQLSADLKSNTELKHKFLEEAVMNLDTSSEVTQGHLSTVLGGLCQKLLAFIHSEPNHKMTRNMRMLLMAAQSLLK